MQFLTIGPFTFPLILAVIVLTALCVKKLAQQKNQHQETHMKLQHMSNFNAISYDALFKRKTVLILTLAVLIILMLLRPVFGTDSSQAQTSSLDIVFSLDSSLSMNVEDFDNSKSRLQGAKSIMMSVLEKRPVERYSLVSFAAKAYTECPLTNDKETIKNAVDTVITNSFFNGGTAVVAGIQEGVQRLTTSKDSTQQNRKKVLILLTDGENVQASTKELSAVASQVRTQNITFITVGIGSKAGGKIPYAEYTKGEKMYVYHNGTYAISKLDESFLKDITSQVKGTYIHANTIQDAQQIIKILDKETSLTTTALDDTSYNETYHFFAFAALITLIIYHFSLYDIVTTIHKKL